MKTLAWKLCGEIFVIAQSSECPTDQDYNSALDGYSKYFGKYRGILISSHGGKMNALQRKRTTDFWEEKKEEPLPKTVVMSSSKSDRAILTGLNWFLQGNTKIKPFAFNDYSGAFGYLNIAGAEKVRVLKALEDLHSQLRSETSQLGS